MVVINIEGHRYEITLGETESIEILINGISQYSHTTATGRETKISFNSEDTVAVV